MIKNKTEINTETEKNITS